jgi:hypothetical protein
MDEADEQDRVRPLTDGADFLWIQCGGENNEFNCFINRTVMSKKR